MALMIIMMVANIIVCVVLYVPVLDNDISQLTIETLLMMRFV